ncbi:MAG: archease [Fimbriimonadales bacterium]|nr:MAG: protein archease [Fimbriimonadales bacterium]
MGKYQILDHTADKGLAVEAASLPDLFETAAQGLFRLMIDPAQYPPTEQVAITLHAPDLEMLMVRWLNELLYQFEVYHRLFSQYTALEVGEADGRWSLTAQAHYRPIEPQQLEWDGAPVKSVTYHGLRLERDSERWILRFFVDV